MRRMVRFMPRILIQSAWNMCGTVVPHCDFHRCSTIIGCASKSCLYARSRSAHADAGGYAYVYERYPDSTTVSSTFTILGNRSNPKQLAPLFPSIQRKSTI